jgi:MYXO-CTERM domain-containing protein
MLAWILVVTVQAQGAPSAKPTQQLMVKPRATDPAVMAPAQQQNNVAAPQVAAPAGATAPAAVPALPPAPPVERKPAAVAATKPEPKPESAGGCACEVSRGSPSLGLVCAALLGLLFWRRR